MQYNRKVKGQRLNRALGRVKRAWLDAPVVSRIAIRRHRAALTKHSPSLPILTSRDESVVAAMRSTGFCEFDLSSDVPANIKSEAAAMISLLALDPSPTSSTRLSADVFIDHPQLFRWGLGEGIIDLAESYIGLPVHYLGVELKREKCDGSGRDVRQWHMDIEDRRMFKMIMYLGEVDDDSGPFEFITSALSSPAAESLGYSSGFVSDSAMAGVVSPVDWRTVVGGPFSGVFVDTRKVFHRIRPPRARDRYSMTFSYTSRTPRQVFQEYLLPPDAVRGLVTDLSPRQQAAALRM